MPDSFPTRSLLTGLLLALAAAPLGAQNKPETPRDAILRLANEFRKSNEVGPLVINMVLNEAAQKHAENMARQDKFGDDGKNGHILDGKKPPDRLAAAGYKSHYYGENVGMMPRGTAAPAQRMLATWKKSPGHRKNLLGADWTETGIGAARSKSGKWYFCHLFGAGDKTPRGAFSVTMENRTKEAVEVRPKGEKEGAAIEPGTTLTVKSPAAAKTVELEVVVKKSSAKPVVIEARNGGVYVITGESGRIKVEEKK